MVVYTAAPDAASHDLTILSSFPRSGAILQVTQLMVPLLKFYFHEDVRIAAVQCMPALLRSATLAVEKNTSPDASMPSQMLDFFWQPLLDAMHKVCLCASAGQATLGVHHTVKHSLPVMIEE